MIINGTEKWGKKIYKPRVIMARVRTVHIQNKSIRLTVYDQNFRACVFCHFCQNNCFFILLSWLPTYFHDNFPEAKSGIFNVVPWILMVPGIGVAALITKKLSRNGHSVTSSRKIIESICLLTEAFCLVCIGEFTCLKVRKTQNQINLFS